MNSDMIIFLEDLKALLLEIDNPELYDKTVVQYEKSGMKDLVSTLDKHIAELDDLSDDEVLDLLTQIVGES